METNTVHVVWGFIAMAVGITCAGVLDVAGRRFWLAQDGRSLVVVVLAALVLVSAAVAVGTLTHPAGLRP